MTAVQQHASYVRTDHTKYYDDEELDKELDWFIGERSTQQVCTHL